MRILIKLCCFRSLWSFLVAADIGSTVFPHLFRSCHKSFFKNFLSVRHSVGDTETDGDISFQTWESCLLLFSFLLSPFGLRGLVAVITNGLDLFKQMLKAI